MKVTNVLVALCSGLSLLSISTAGAQCTPPNGETFSLAMKPGAPQAPYKVHFSLLDPDKNGEKGIPTTALVDTGSTGIVIAKGALPKSINTTGLPIEGFGYTSSDNYMIGQFVNVKVQFPGTSQGKPGTVTTNSLPVLAVSCGCKFSKGAASNTQPLSLARCEENNGKAAIFGNSSDAYNLSSCTKIAPHMMGVGFARGNSGPEKNPFLQIDPASMPGLTAHKGYIIGKNGQITLGINADSAAQIQSKMQLVAQKQDNSTGMNWAAPSACVSLTAPNTKTIATTLCGELLVDTGIDFMFLGFDSSLIPKGAATHSKIKFDGVERTLVSSGYQLGFAFPNAQNPGFRDTLTTVVPQGNKPPLTSPSQVVATWVNPPATSVASDAANSGFINTGRKILQSGSVMYDATCGIYGLGDKVGGK